jgi:hypothetical protein
MIKKYVVLLSFELFLVFLYFHYQPKCFPCPEKPCPPCISKEQKIIKNVIVIPIILFSVFLICSFVNKQNTRSADI